LTLDLAASIVFGASLTKRLAYSKDLAAEDFAAGREFKIELEIGSVSYKAISPSEEEELLRAGVVRRVFSKIEDYRVDADEPSATEIGFLSGAKRAARPAEGVFLLADDMTDPTRREDALKRVPRGQARVLLTIVSTIGGKILTEDGVLSALLSRRDEVAATYRSKKPTDDQIAASFRWHAKHSFSNLVTEG
jgi:hypothetical protein